MKRFIWETLRGAALLRSSPRRLPLLGFHHVFPLPDEREVPVLSGGLQVRLYQEPRASLLTEAKRKVGLLVPESSFDFDYYLIILIVVQLI